MPDTMQSAPCPHQPRAQGGVFSISTLQRRKLRLSEVKELGTKVPLGMNGEARRYGSEAHELGCYVNHPQTVHRDRTCL